MDASTLAHVINMRGVRIMGANNSFGDGYPV
jgi:hypothetical protein